MKEQERRHGDGCNSKLDMVYKKIKIFNFFGKAQKRSKLSENDIYIFISKTFTKIWCKSTQPKKRYGGPKLMRLHFCWQGVHGKNENPKPQYRNRSLLQPYRSFEEINFNFGKRSTRSGENRFSFFLKNRKNTGNNPLWIVKNWYTVIWMS